MLIQGSHNGLRVKNSTVVDRAAEPTPTEVRLSVVWSSMNLGVRMFGIRRNGVACCWRRPMVRSIRGRCDPLSDSAIDFAADRLPESFKLQISYDDPNQPFNSAVRLLINTRHPAHNALRSGAQRHLRLGTAIRHRTSAHRNLVQRRTVSCSRRMERRKPWRSRRPVVSLHPSLRQRSRTISFRRDPRTAHTYRTPSATWSRTNDGTMGLPKAVRRQGRTSTTGPDRRQQRRTRRPNAAPFEAEPSRPENRRSRGST